MRYDEALAYLDKIQGETFKLSLDNIQRVIDRAPFAASAVRCVQVAGTNGKGSTSHFIASILQCNRWRVGLFTSPHLQDVRERIQVDGRPISRVEFARSVGVVRDLVARLRVCGEIANLPTFFETLFLAALHYFAWQKVDWAVLEVGLGGRLDATTTVVPEAAVITNVAMDHMDILGKTLEAIAREKAGVIRPNVPVVCGCPPRSVAARVIRAVAQEKCAPLTFALAPPQRLEVERERGSYSCHYVVPERVHRFLVTQRGRHQARNAALAVATIEVLKQCGWEVSDAAIRRGIRAMRIPARIERLGCRPPVIIDGGHNRAGIQTLVDYLKEENVHGFTLLFGVLKDKQYPAMARLLAPLARRIVLTDPASARALPAEKLRRFFPGKECIVERDYARALAIAKKFKRTIIVCGSLYLVGGMRTIVRGGKKHGYQKIERDRRII